MFYDSVSFTMRRLGKIIAIAVVIIFASGFILLQVFSNTGAPVQPIEFDHWQHVSSEDGPQMDCTACHEHADKSPHATIPNVSTCMICHEVIKTDSPEIQKLAAFAEQNTQPPWVRIYYSDASANVFFTHKAHTRAGIDCSTCHGQVAQLHRQQRMVEHSMGWCMDCHQERKVSVDCYVCHR